MNAVACKVIQFLSYMIMTHVKASFWGLFRTKFTSHFSKKSCKLILEILIYYIETERETEREREREKRERET